MGIALESASEMGLKLPGLELAKGLYDKLSGQGGADEGTQALFRFYMEGKQSADGARLPAQQ